MHINLCGYIAVAVVVEHQNNGHSAPNNIFAFMYVKGVEISTDSSCKICGERRVRERVRKRKRDRDIEETEKMKERVRVTRLIFKRNNINR